MFLEINLKKQMLLGRDTGHTVVLLCLLRATVAFGERAVQHGLDSFSGKVKKDLFQVMEFRMLILLVLWYSAYIRFSKTHLCSHVEPKSLRFATTVPPFYQDKLLEN